MHLYTYFRSSASFRVRIALNLKGLEWDAVPVNLKEGRQRDTNYLSANPQGFVPALAVDGEIFSQSLAIIEYLEETVPEPRILPLDPVGRAHIRAMAQLISCDIHPLNNLRVLKYLKTTYDQDEDAINQWYRHWIQEGFHALEDLVNRFGSETNCFGSEISLADLCLAPQMWNARRFHLDLSPFPQLAKIDSCLVQIPAFSEAKPENQSDFS